MWTQAGRVERRLRVCVCVLLRKLCVESVWLVCEQLPESLFLHSDPADTHDEWRSTAPADEPKKEEAAVSGTGPCWDGESLAPPVGSPHYYESVETEGDRSKPTESECVCRCVSETGRHCLIQSLHGSRLWAQTQEAERGG